MHLEGGKVIGRGYDVYPRRIEIPMFGGEDPIGWIFRADKYFFVNCFRAEDKVQAVGVCMEGLTLTWLQWEEARGLFGSWEEFKETLIERFQLTREGTTYKELLSLR